MSGQSTNHTTSDQTPSGETGHIELAISKINADFWSSWIDQLRCKIEDSQEPKKDLKDAPHFVSWVLLSCEYLSSQLKSMTFINSGLYDSKSLDEGYVDTIKHYKEKMDSNTFAAMRFTIGCRHVIIHKGFPNMHRQTLLKKRGFTNDELYAILEVITNPSRFEEILQRFQVLERWVSENIASIHSELRVELGGQP